MQRDAAVTIFEKSSAGRRAAVLPPLDVPERPLEELVPRHLLRDEPPAAAGGLRAGDHPPLQPLSRRNFDLDTGFYPLGSCTMKHNPRLNERVAALPGTRGCTRCSRPSAHRARSS